MAGIQQTVQDVAPWAAAAAATVTALTGLISNLGPRRLRAGLRQDAELHALLPDGEAKTALEESLAHQANALRDRVVNGIWLTRRQRAAGYAVLMIFSGVLATTVFPESSDSALGGVWTPVAGVVSVLGLAMAGIGLFALGVMTSWSVAEWLDRRTPPRDLGSRRLFGRTLRPSSPVASPARETQATTNG